MGDALSAIVDIGEGEWTAVWCNRIH